MTIKKITFIILLVLVTVAEAQESPEKLLTEFTPFLSKAYYNFNLGLVYYPYTNEHLKPGNSAGGTKANAFSGRFLIGYKFNENFAMQFGVMRPAAWFQYTNLNGEQFDKSVWINLWSLSLKKNFNLNNRLSIYGELGVGNLNRVGFSIGDEIIFPDAQYATIVTGAGFEYTLSSHWDLLLNATYLPSSEKHNQPHTFQSTVGLLYNLRQIPRKKAEEIARDSTYFFPKRILQIGYGTSEIGFYANEFFSMNAKIGNFESFGIPVFWLGDSRASHTVSLTYQQTAYHSEKFFSLDWGVSITGFQTEATKTNVFAFSIFPVLRFYVLRKKPLDVYMCYSIIGPTFLTKSNIDNLGTGPKLTYQDFIGLGGFIGKERKLNVELRIMHYSNGNIFSDNSGVAVPIVFTLGRTF